MWKPARCPSGKWSASSPTMHIVFGQVMATEIEGRTLGKRSGALGAVAAQSLVLAILQSEQRYQKIYECFHVLYDLAHVTRYSAQPTRWIPADQVEKRVVKELVYP